MQRKIKRLWIATTAASLLLSPIAFAQQGGGSGGSAGGAGGAQAGAAAGAGTAGGVGNAATSAQAAAAALQAQGGATGGVGINPGAAGTAQGVENRAAAAAQRATGTITNRATRGSGTSAAVRNRVNQNSRRSTAQMNRARGQTRPQDRVNQLQEGGLPGSAFDRLEDPDIDISLTDDDGASAATGQRSRARMQRDAQTRGRQGTEMQNRSFGNTREDIDEEVDTEVLGHQGSEAQSQTDDDAGQLDLDESGVRNPSDAFRNPSDDFRNPSSSFRNPSAADRRQFDRRTNRRTTDGTNLPTRPFDPIDIPGIDEDEAAVLGADRQQTSRQQQGQATGGRNLPTRPFDPIDIEGIDEEEAAVLGGDRRQQPLTQEELEQQQEARALGATDLRTRTDTQSRRAQTDARTRSRVGFPNREDQEAVGDPGLDARERARIGVPSRDQEAVGDPRRPENDQIPGRAVGRPDNDEVPGRPFNQADDATLTTETDVDASGRTINRSDRPEVGADPDATGIDEDGFSDLRTRTGQQGGTRFDTDRPEFMRDGSNDAREFDIQRRRNADRFQVDDFDSDIDNQVEPDFQGDQFTRQLDAFDVDSLGAQFTPADNGLVISSLTPNGFFADAGLQEGDVLVSAFGRPITSLVDFQNLLMTSDFNDRIPLIVFRDGVRQRMWLDAADLLTFTSGFNPLLPLGVQFDTTNADQLVFDRISPNSVLARSGILPGDILLSVNGQPVSTIREFSEVMLDTAPGVEIPVAVQRNGRPTTVMVRPSDLQAAGNVSAGFNANAGVGLTGLVDGGGEWLGVTLDPSFSSNAVVQSVAPGSAAAEAGLRVGDVITRINGRRITSAAQLAELLSSLESADSIDIDVARRGAERLRARMK